MANFTASVLALGQAKFKAEFIALGEWRPVDHAALTVMTKGEITNPLLKVLRTSPKRSIEAYMPIAQASTGGTTRNHDHTGSFGDSLKQPITWSTLSETFKVSKKLADNNVITGAEMFAAGLKNAVDNLLSRSNALLIAELVAAKTEENKGGANGSFNATTHNYEIPNTQKDYFFQEVQAMLQKNRYPMGLVSIADTKAAVLATRVGWQGATNAQNLNPQFEGQTLVRTNEEIITGQAGSVITFPAGGAAFIPWIPLLNRKNLNPTQIENNVGDFGQISIPEIGVDFAIHAYTLRADTDSEGGSTQDDVTEFEVSIDWGFVSSPISVANETNVFTSVLLS